jgi:serine-type D-Ala-D-Ala carboxypeptidase/endopeptidase (penicillin-binding protein 4)
LEALKDLDEERGLRNGIFSFCLKNVKSQETVINHNADRSVVIASNMKAVTTAAALDMLGDNFTFETKLQFDGQLLPDGTLNGNVYITGGGDPTLGSKRVRGSLSMDEIMMLWVNKIRASGIRKINGAVIADADFWEENAVPQGWAWGDMGNYYGAAVFGLNINDNMYYLTFKSAPTEGLPTRILNIQPNIPELAITSTVKTGKPALGDQAYIYGAIYGNYQFIEGTIPAGVAEFTIKGAIPDAPKTCSQVFTQYLNKFKIPVSSEGTSTRLMRRQGKLINTARQNIYIHQSPPLKDIVAFTNLYSMNLYAEALAKALGKKVYNEGSTYMGVNAIRGHWFEKGIKNAGFFMKDGSGLSRTNAATTSQLTDILSYMTKQPTFSTFYASLPVAGVSGTMAPLCRETVAAGNLRAKSGSVDRVKSWCGYFKSQSGALYSFSLIANDYEMPYETLQERVEKIMVMMVKLA